MSSGSLMSGQIYTEGPPGPSTMGRTTIASAPPAKVAWGAEVLDYCVWLRGGGPGRSADGVGCALARKRACVTGGMSLHRLPG